MSTSIKHIAGRKIDGEWHVFSIRCSGNPTSIMHAECSCGWGSGAIDGIEPNFRSMARAQWDDHIDQKIDKFIPKKIH